jgi:hypothetical protein
MRRTQRLADRQYGKNLQRVLHLAGNGDSKAMNATVIEAVLAMFWLGYLGLHLWLLRADPVEEAPMILEVQE